MMYNTVPYHININIIHHIITNVCWYDMYGVHTIRHTVLIYCRDAEYREDDYPHKLGST